MRIINKYPAIESLRGIMALPFAFSSDLTNFFEDEEEDEDEESELESGILNIEIDGFICLGALENFKQIINTNIEVSKAVLLCINSNGGMTLAGEQFYLFIKDIKAKYPNVKWFAYCESVVASAGYWIASACDEIIGLDSNLNSIGGIGNVFYRWDKSKVLESEGVKVNIFTNQTAKLFLNSDLPLTNEEKKSIQEDLENADNIFLGAVFRERNISIEELNALNGECFNSYEALNLKLIDKIMTKSALIASIKNSLLVSPNNMDTENNNSEIQALQEQIEALKKENAKINTTYSLIKTDFDSVIAEKKNKAISLYQAFVNTELDEKHPVLQAVNAMSSLREVEDFIKQKEALLTSNSIPTVAVEQKISDQVDQESFQKLENSIKAFKI